MQKLLFAAWTAFGRSFALTFLASAAGILGATNTDAAVALSIAALVGSIVAGLKAISVYVPLLTFASLLPQPWAAWLDAAVQQAAAAFIVFATGWLAAPNWSAWHAALTGVIQGVAVAFVRGLQGAVTPGESPAPEKGLPEPPPTPRIA